MNLCQEMGSVSLTFGFRIESIIYVKLIFLFNKCTVASLNLLGSDLSSFASRVLLSLATPALALSFFGLATDSHFPITCPILPSEASASSASLPALPHLWAIYLTSYLDSKRGGRACGEALEAEVLKAL